MNLLLIDLSHIFWTRWHATAGQGPDAAFQASYECVQSLRDGHDETIVCCDVGKSWRHQVEPTYKANRPQRDPAAYDQLRRLREQLDRDGYPTVHVEGFEADDIIATLAVQAADAESVTIATGDKDLLQLVDQRVACISTNAGQDRTRRGPDFVQQKFGVSPEQLRDWLALVGDKSDNITGCPGVGEKTATKLLSDFATIEGIYARLNEIDSVPLRTKLTEHRGDVEKARKLVTLSRDVPITLAEALIVRPAAPVVESGECPEDSGSDDDGDPSTSSNTSQDAGNPGPEKPALSSRDDRPTSVAGGESPAAALSVSSGSAVSEAIVLDKSDPRWSLALEPRGLKQVWWLAEHLYNSQLYRKFPNADAIAAAILKGRSMGLDMMTSLDCINVIEGKPSMGAMAIIGVVLSSGKAEYFDFVSADDKSATWETLRIGRKTPVRLTYTIDRAEAAGLLRPGKNGYPSNWTKRPEEMLTKQAGVMLARRVYPDVVSNVYDPDELGGE